MQQSTSIIYIHNILDMACFNAHTLVQSVLGARYTVVVKQHTVDLVHRNLRIEKLDRWVSTNEFHQLTERVINFNAHLQLNLIETTTGFLMF